MILRRLLMIALMATLVVLAVALAVTLVVDKSVAKAQTNAEAANGNGTSTSSSKSYGFANATELLEAAGNATKSTVKKISIKDVQELFSTNSTTTKDGAKQSPGTVKAQPNATATASAASASAGDPEKEKFSLHALAIGDWGVSPAGDSCCAKYAKVGHELYRDQQAQTNVAYLLSLSATKLKPKAILSHGDNFYWNGVGLGDAKYRFENTFEGIYTQKSLENVPWLNVLGNHDYGGSAFLCGDSDNAWHACTTQQEMEKALDARFTAQSKYKSPNGDRWKLPSHYYKETLQDKTTGLSVDIFNVDTNAATVHGADQVCCQCYGYQAGVDKSAPGYIDCNAVHRGHKMCFGGNNQLFDACVSKFTKWTNDSLEKLARDTKASKADWKIVNSHYSPHYHMNPLMMKKWFDVLAKGNVQLFINGHTHAESHDISKFNTHFITNGAGGGIQSESIGKPPPYVTEVEMLWGAKNSPYGFFELSFSKNWLRTKFITFDTKWKFSEDPNKTIRGDGDVQHCWFIPKNGAKGQECSKK